MSSGESRSARVQRTLDALTEGQTAANAYDRPDLAHRLQLTAERLIEPSFHVLVVGEFKQGKSTLVNALVGSQICPVDDDIATAVPTAVRWAEAPKATAFFAPPADAGEDSEVVAEPIAMGEVQQYAVEHADRDDNRTVRSVEIGLNNELLRDGLVLVDTPGVGGLGSAHSAITMAALSMAEAVIFLSDASQEFTAPEVDFMHSARDQCPNIVCVVTRTDFYPAWRKIRDLNAGHLERLGVGADIFAVSAVLHQRARAAGDDELDAESGFPGLIQHLKTEIVGRAEELSVATAVSDFHAVVDQLIAHFQARKAALDNPESAPATVAELEAARARAAELRSRAARWQQTLSDGVQDITADIDHDLRGRFRKINQEFDDAIDQSDPADTWDEFEPWLYRRVAADVVQNYGVLQERATELAEVVAEHFDMENQELLVNLDVGDPTAAARVGVTADLEVDKMGAGEKAMTGVRGGYMATLMLGAMTSMVGLALGPIPIAAGLIMGRKQVRDEKKRQLEQRRAQAKAVQRKYMDELAFLSNKDSRDALRQTNRELRNYFTTRADEQALSLEQTLSAVQTAVKTDRAGRQRELANVTAELKRLDGLRQRIDPPAPQGGPGG